jgi:hypothetical protein
MLLKWEASFFHGSLRFMVVFKIKTAITNIWSCHLKKKHWNVNWKMTHYSNHSFLHPSIDSSIHSFIHSFIRWVIPEDHGSLGQCFWLVARSVFAVRSCPVDYLELYHTIIASWDSGAIEVLRNLQRQPHSGSFDWQSLSPHHTLHPAARRSQSPHLSCSGAQVLNHPRSIRRVRWSDPFIHRLSGMNSENPLWSDRCGL